MTRTQTKQYFPWGTGNPTFYLVLLFAAAATGTLVVAWAEESAAAVTTGLAAFMGGGILGFLFGIPRYASSTADKALLDAEAVKYQANTNLEQISDWLTKILVGVGLTQFRAIGDAAGRLVSSVGGAVAGGDKGRVEVAGLLILAGVAGFLFFYLWSRIYLPVLFAKAERPQNAEGPVPPSPSPHSHPQPETFPK